MYYRTAISLLALSLAAAGCATETERKPEQGPDQIVAGPPGPDDPVAAAPVQEGPLGEPQVNGADRGESVALRFDFPTPLTGTVTQRVVGTGSMATRFAHQHRVKVVEAEEGLRVRSYDGKAVPIDDSKEARERAETVNYYSGDVLKKIDYTLVVDNEAGIFRTENLDTAKLVMQQRLMPTQHGEKIIKRFARAFIDAANVDLEPEMTWILSVQFWAGQELKVGEKKEAHFVSLYPTASRGFQRATINVDYMVTGRVRCTPRAAERNCVELRLSAVPDPDELTLAARRMHAKVKPTLVDELRGVLPGAKTLTSRMDLDLVVDPDTLVPYRIERAVQDRLVLENGQVQTPTSHIETVYRYR